MNVLSALLPVLGLAGYLLARKGISARKIDFALTGVDIKKFSISNPVIVLRVQLINPTNVSQQVDALFLNVIADGRTVARVQYNNIVQIPQLNSVSVNIPVKLNAIEAGLLAAKYIQGKKIEYKISGTLNSLGISIPIQYTL